MGKKLKAKNPAERLSWLGQCRTLGFIIAPAQSGYGAFGKSPFLPPRLVESRMLTGERPLDGDFRESQDSRQGEGAFALTAVDIDDTRIGKVANNDVAGTGDVCPTSHMEL